MTGRDEPRTRPSHPTVDELADLREGLLSAADEARIQAHVAGCDECAAETAAIDEVAVALREVGTEPVTMPAAVARAIDDAIGAASADRAAAPFTPPARSATVDAARPRRQWVKPTLGWLAGAAAAVVVLGGVGIGLNGIESGSDNSAGGAADSVLVPEASAPSTEYGQGGSLDGKNLRPKRVDKQTLPSYARALDDAAARPPTAQEGQQQRPGSNVYAWFCAAPRGMGGLERPVVWRGNDALLVVRHEARVASVYSCDATPRLLYSAPY